MWEVRAMENRGHGEGRPKGWSSLTRLHRHPTPPRDSFPSLGSERAVSGLDAVADGRPSQLQGLAGPFVSPVRRLHPQDSKQSIASRLRERYSWADELLIEDVLRAVDGDQGVASVQLDAMSPQDFAGNSGAGEVSDDLLSTPPILLAREATDSEQSPSFQMEDGRIVDIEDGSVQEASSSGVGVPVEPEWEEDDLYVRLRREALRMVRARNRHARSAVHAFTVGDHSLAKKLSREAQENWKLAEKLQAEAAAKILCAKNSGGQTDLWTLDLHGLHVLEAVAVLQQRLALLEDELVENPSAGFFPSLVEIGEGFGANPRDGQLENQALRQAARVPVQRDVRVITGVGRHSKNGPALPSAIKNFLINHGYKYNDTKPGVVSVYPKRRYLNDSGTI